MVLPKGTRITKFCADSATYQADIINECNRKDDPIDFFIGARLDQAIKQEKTSTCKRTAVEANAATAFSIRNNSRNSKNEEALQ